MPNSFASAQRLVLTAGLALALAAGVLAFGGALTPQTTHAQSTLAAPDNPSPTNGSSIGTNQFTNASWSSVNGSSTPITYRYESSLSASTNTDGSFMTPVFQSGTLTSPQISTASTSPGTYFWHVQAVDNSGATSTWSPTWSVTVTNANSSTTLPVISNIVVNPNDTGATVTWATDQVASSQVSWGASTNYTASTTLDTTPVLNHSATLTGLSPDTTYHFSVMSTNGNGSVNSFDQTFMTMMSSSTGTTTNPGGGSQSDLITALENLINQFPQFTGQILGIINQLQSGNTVGNSAPASIDQAGGTYPAGGSIDFGGRNFGHEETINVMLNGSLVAAPHADGGGNFSTGSIPLPSAPGDYHYTFTGQTSGISVPATIHLQ